MNDDDGDVIGGGGGDMNVVIELVESADSAAAEVHSVETKKDEEDGIARGSDATSIFEHRTTQQALLTDLVEVKMKKVYEKNYLLEYIPLSFPAGSILADANFGIEIGSSFGFRLPFQPEHRFAVSGVGENASHLSRNHCCNHRPLQKASLSNSRIRTVPIHTSDTLLL